MQPRGGKFTHFPYSCKAAAHSIFSSAFFSPLLNGAGNINSEIPVCWAIAALFGMAGVQLREPATIAASHLVHDALMQRAGRLQLAFPSSFELIDN